MLWREFLHVIQQQYDIGLLSFSELKGHKPHERIPLNLGDRALLKRLFATCRQNSEKEGVNLWFAYLKWYILDN